MKIKQLILLAISLPILLTVGGAVLFQSQIERVSRNYDVIVSLEIPLSDALLEIKAAVIRVVASTSEYGFILAEQSHTKRGDSANESSQNTIAAESEELSLIRAGEASLLQALTHYEQLRNKERATDADYFKGQSDQQLDISIGQLLAISRQIVAAKKKGVTGQTILELKESFEAVEQSSLNQLSSIHQQIHDHTRSHYSMALKSTAIMRWLSLVLPGVLAFVLACVGGLLMFKLVVPISKLEAVVQRVRRGEPSAVAALDTERNDEIGLFNLAFRDLINEHQACHVELKAAKGLAEATSPCRGS